MTDRPIFAVDEPARWVTKADRAYAGIRRAILSGSLEPNEQINPREIATELEMSVIPVREALRRLEQEGFVTIRPHIGAAVRELPVAELRENLLIRSELEALAARLAAPLMTDTVIAQLQEILDQGQLCIDQNQYDQFGTLNRQFHLTAYDVIAEKGLLRLIEQQWDQVPRAASVFALVPEHAVIAQKEHAAILDAFRGKDAETVAALTREHKLRARVVQLKAVDSNAGKAEAATSKTGG